MVFDRLGSFAPAIWGISVLMVSAAFCLGMGMPAESHDKLNRKSYQSVECSADKMN
jgi:hypothetical protein